MRIDLILEQDEKSLENVNSAHVAGSVSSLSEARSEGTRQSGTPRQSRLSIISCDRKDSNFTQLLCKVSFPL